MPSLQWLRNFSQRILFNTSISVRKLRTMYKRIPRQPWVKSASSFYVSFCSSGIVHQRSHQWFFKWRCNLLDRILSILSITAHRMMFLQWMSRHHFSKWQRASTLSNNFPPELIEKKNDCRRKIFFDFRIPIFSRWREFRRPSRRYGHSGNSSMLSELDPDHYLILKAPQRKFFKFEK